MPYVAAGPNDTLFIQRFAISWTNYCKANNICMADAFRAVKQEKGVNFTKDKLYEWRKGRICRPVYIYSMNALAEAVGLTINDFFQPVDPSKIQICKLSA